MTKKLFLLISLLLVGFSVQAKIYLDSSKAEISNDAVSIKWEKSKGVWVLKEFNALSPDASSKAFGALSGEYSVIYSDVKPKFNDPVEIIENGEKVTIEPPALRRFNFITSPVPMSRAGVYDFFYPTAVKKTQDALIFSAKTDNGTYTATWRLSEKFSSDIDVELSFTASKAGFYSLPTPTLASIEEKDLKWGIVPGWYQGSFINKKLVLSYGYAQGLPYEPTICRENTITTMSAIMENKAGVSLAITPTPGQDRNAYTDNQDTHKMWKVGLSHMNKHYKLTPMAYHPVLGSTGSEIKAGEKLDFKFTITLKNNDWYKVYKHAIYDIYKLDVALNFKDTKQSLADRVLSIKKYCLDDTSSMWRTDEFGGMTIGAQSYHGTVHGADRVKKDAVKNSDIGAVWMLAAISDDKNLKETRLPYIRNFKVAQQQTEDGFFQGAAKGQYYLRIKKIFTEEWGSHFEPIGLTYYTLADIGNILLFQPNDTELQKLLRLGADKLLKWQRQDGGFEVAYDVNSKEPIFKDLQDLRPTFYGFVIAYRILGDKKYLEAAKKGADWFIKNAVEKSSFLGVCGDARFINDFATAQGAQALLDVYDLTGETAYLDAAIKTAKMYTTSVFTHPIPSAEIKKRFYKNEDSVTEKDVYDWQLNQVGLSFEHGGGLGSATDAGPILLASHCGMFLRMYKHSGDKLFLDLARAGALGRDAFVNQNTKVASYYWHRFDEGSGRFPHHAWWQVGWIMDYIVAEAEVRSNGAISFPRGFITPKVGPHLSLGFAAGKIDGNACNLILRDDLVVTDNPNINYITALGTDGKTLYVVLMNDQTKENTFNVKIGFKEIAWGSAEFEGKSVKELLTTTQTLAPFGIKILKLSKID